MSSVYLNNLENKGKGFTWKGFISPQTSFLSENVVFTITINTWDYYYWKKITKNSFLFFLYILQHFLPFLHSFIELFKFRILQSLNYLLHSKYIHSPGEFNLSFYLAEKKNPCILSPREKKTVCRYILKYIFFKNQVLGLTEFTFRKWNNLKLLG